MSTYHANADVSASGGSGGGNTTTLDTYANVPGGPVVGDIHYCTDCPLIRRYNGTTWDNLVPGTVGVWTEVTATDFTPRVSTSGTQTQVGGTMVLSTTAEMRVDKVAANATFRAEMALQYFVLGTNASVIFGALNQSAGGKSVFAYHRSDRALVVQRDNPWGTFSATVDNDNFIPAAGVVVSAVEYDGTNLIYEISTNGGATFDVVHTETAATFPITPVAWGLGITTPGGERCGMTVLGYRET